MNRSVITAETPREPITLREAKKHLEIEDAETHHDAHVMSLIVAGREQWEHDTQTLAVRRSVTETLACWPDDGWRLRFRPSTAEAVVAYFDPDGLSVTLDPTGYSIDVANRMIHPAPGETWPTSQERWDAISITYTSGCGNIHETARHAVRLQVDLMFGLRIDETEKNAVDRAYEHLVEKFKRSSYP